MTLTMATTATSTSTFTTVNTTVATATTSTTTKAATTTTLRQNVMNNVSHWSGWALNDAYCTKLGPERYIIYGKPVPTSKLPFDHS